MIEYTYWEWLGIFIMLGGYVVLIILCIFILINETPTYPEVRKKQKKYSMSHEEFSKLLKEANELCMISHISTVHSEKLNKYLKCETEGCHGSVIEDMVELGLRSYCPKCWDRVLKENKL